MTAQGQVSIKKNFAYKSILTVASYLVAFVVFPYVSRVLGVANIGIVDFVDNTLQYFLLFATMGIGVLGVREIAKVKDNPQEMNKVFSNLLGVNLLFTILTLVVYLSIVTLSPKLSQYSELFYAGSAKIIFTAFLLEWFYTGIENFRYVAIRSIIIKVLYVIAILIFVKESQDYKLYFYLTIAMTVCNSVVNLIYSHRFVKIEFRELVKFRYISQNIILGIYSIMTSMYLTFNVMYLGLITNNVQVGYYTTAYKLYTVVLGFFSAFTSVMLPRMSALVSGDQTEHFKSLVSKSFIAMAMFTIPLILCSIVIAPQLIYVIAGPNYDGAIIPMRVIMPAVLLVGIAQILALQVLMPLKKEKVLLLASVLGALTGIIINITVVRHLQCIGSSIVLLSSEFVVTMVYVIYICRNHIVKLPFCELVKSLIVSIPSVLVTICCGVFIRNPFLCVSLAILIALLCWVLMMYSFRKKILFNVLGIKR